MTKEKIYKYARQIFVESNAFGWGRLMEYRETYRFPDRHRDNDEYSNI